jgi:hypothetical protein
LGFGFRVWGLGFRDLHTGSRKGLGLGFGVRRLLHSIAEGGGGRRPIHFRPTMVLLHFLGDELLLEEEHLLPDLWNVIIR